MPTRPGPARRLLDVVVAAVALVGLAPVLMVVALIVRATDGGPVLFRQVRLGEEERPFVLVKFRSMRASAGGPQVTASGDPRVTRLGRVLRATSIDELPQLWHVLRGQMTLVGPRPETQELARGYPDDCRWVLRCRPGLTGPAQLALRDTAALDPAADPEQDYLLRLVPLRARLDAEYQRDPSLRRTAGVLLQTAAAVAGGVPGLRHPRVQRRARSAT